MELEHYLKFYESCNSAPFAFRSIYFGGGTPSLANPSVFSLLINYLKERNLLMNDAEITLEANPTDAEQKIFQEFRKIGINRLSLGIQSFLEEDLKYLGRNHSTLVCSI